jgi:hypothetical protein
MQDGAFPPWVSGSSALYEQDRLGSGAVRRCELRWSLFGASGQAFDAATAQASAMETTARGASWPMERQGGENGRRVLKRDGAQARDTYSPIPGGGMEPRCLAASVLRWKHQLEYYVSINVSWWVALGMRHSTVQLEVPERLAGPGRLPIRPLHR